MHTKFNRRFVSFIEHIWITQKLKYQRKEAAEKLKGAESFITNRIHEIYSQEKLSAEGVIYFFVSLPAF